MVNKTAGQVDMMIPHNKPHIFLMDSWPPSTLTEDKMRVYKRLEKRGTIEIIAVKVSKSTGKTDVSYRSTIPEEFLKPEFREELLNIQRAGGGVI